MRFKWKKGIFWYSGLILGAILSRYTDESFRLRILIWSKLLKQPSFTKEFFIEFTKILFWRRFLPLLVIAIILKWIIFELGLISGFFIGSCVLSSVGYGIVFWILYFIWGYYVYMQIPCNTLKKWIQILSFLFLNCINEVFFCMIIIKILIKF
ncbi:hypothetical protein P261_00716 [Lachnospiraceae bacterium TWA4]|nr:hypothetical protein P261_00716 [Lachnospiraceae bacterium TWA4]